MVGVPKSTGCGICRKRKIKCDENWPHCLNCQKNGKCCPGPPARHTFKDLGPRLNLGATVVREDNSPAALDQRYRSLTQLNEKFAENGSVLHKFRISHKGCRPQTKTSRRSSSTSLSPPKSPLLRQPSPSQHHELARALIVAITTGGAGHRMSVFGRFIREVPARIGHNAALDAAVAVLANAHTSLIHKKMSNEIVSPELYIRAIKTLQSSLEDPQQGLSTNTLCASVLLGLVEALAGPRVGNRYLAHVGGAGRLMELQGPEKYRDPFAKEILRFNRGGIIVTSIYEREECFLISPEWRNIAFDKSGLGFDDCLHTDLMQYMAELPGIFHDLKQLRSQATFPSMDTMEHHLRSNRREPLGGQLSDTFPSLDFSPDSFDSFDLLSKLQPVDTPCSVNADICLYLPARIALLHKVQDLKDALCNLGTHMDAKLANGTTMCEFATMEEQSPIHTSYHFNNWSDMTAYNCFWSVLILTNKIMMRLLPPFDPAIYDLESECRSVALQICKTWEDAWATKPIGAFHTGLSFVLAFEYCTPDVQEWIVRGLNSLLDYQMVDAFRWSEDVITMMSSKLAGEGPDLVFSNVNLSNETQ
ncbi:uncharacterized protein K460DRAFT_393443 [Cucurbitaria berberidis CBS 394.84]|uniref:Zn(2)-C6 fungal-type domain-containing protein n=1 Tax=Cucurbitaria berberidis CBS 394.84 TaxID=1168544 RepID=A0A9P4LAS8_9PLEO|nr:uncharacterized protein K460DRAFT_393443 [Cucurbitaria berberidis CBS 394.84]KAF1848345.1 hypothetical protein K460DRAFT_393443 [Cucurbitaria berberidis CBS 394.84]